jgi:hypothetical protein
MQNSSTLPPIQPQQRTILSPTTSSTGTGAIKNKSVKAKSNSMNDADLGLFVAKIPIGSLRKLNEEQLEKRLQQMVHA